MDRLQAGRCRITTSEPGHRDLADKLLSTLHLNLRERREVPPGGLPGSALVAAVAARLRATGWFPSPPPDGDWSGACVEQRGDDVWVHERHEVGVGRYGPVQSTRVADVADATRHLVAALGGAPIDGVAIDWRA